MNVSDFIHPEDQEALKRLNEVPMAPKLMKQIMGFYDERMTYGQNMGTKIRLSPTQMPHIYGLLPPICEKLKIPEPEFYLQMNPEPNAYAMGENRPNITLQSGILDLMTEDELTAVLAHECGHILCHHMLYTTMVSYILQDKIFQLDTGVFEALIVALLYWNRKSELSCDRVAAYVTSPETTVSMLSRLAGGRAEQMYDFNIEEYAKQSLQYEDIRSMDFWSKTLQSINIVAYDHPFTAVRVREILKWTRSEQYINIMAEIPMCPYCHKQVEDGWKFCRHCGKPLK